MTMVARQIVGYDPKTEKVEFEFCIPASKWNEVLSLVDKNELDPLGFYSYRLDISTANDIMGRVGAGRVAPDLNYFLELEASEV